MENFVVASGISSDRSDQIVFGNIKVDHLLGEKLTTLAPLPVCFRMDKALACRGKREDDQRG